MKKTILTALVVLLVMLAFASCDNIITEPGAEKPGYTYTADGQKFVTVSIKTGGTAGSSRSLSNAIARGAADYVEVIFKEEVPPVAPATDSTYNYYKAEGNLNTTLTILLPVKTYNSSNSVMLIGRNSDKTLLATGTIDGPVDLSKGISEITFTVTSLNVNLTAGGGSFTITNKAALGAFKDDTENGVFYNSSTCFLVPQSSGIMASLTISGFGDAGDNILEKVDSTTFNPLTSLTFNKYTNGTPASTSDIDVIYLSPATISSSGGCEISFVLDTDTNSAEGYYAIYFEIPVIGLNTIAIPVITSNPIGAGLTWYIRGGTNLNAADSTGNAGAGVALRVATNVAEGTSTSISIPPIIMP